MPDRCSSCGAEVRWAATDAGKFMPFDAKPDPRGEWRLAPAPAGRPPRAVHVPRDRRPALRAELMLPHWASCPFADEHRRRSNA